MTVFNLAFGICHLAFGVCHLCSLSSGIFDFGI
jgi:hypothetical protein